MSQEKQELGYIRVSNKDHENSLPTQRKILHDDAARRGVKLLKIYEEKKSAFGKQNRKVFKQMIEHLRKDNISGVVFHKVDRSGRNMPDFALLESFFDTKNIRVIEGEFNTKTAQGRFQFRMFCNMAVWYSENLSEEVRSKMQHCVRKGYFPGVNFFGYRKGRKPNAETGEKGDADPYLKHPDHNAKHVRKIYELYDTGNYSFRAIAKLMNEDGIRNVGGGRFTKGTIERILSNEFYAGWINWGETNRQKRPAMHEKGKHDAIISEPLFKRVKDRREGRTRGKGGYGKQTYSRVFRCGCKHPLYPETPRARNGSREYTYLRCNNPQCSFTSMREEDLEDLVVEKLLDYHIRPEFFAEYKEAMSDMSTMVLEENQKQREAANMRLVQIEAQMQRIRQGFVQGVLEAEEAGKMRQALNEEKESLLKTLGEESTAMDEAYFKTAQHFLETFQILASKYKNAPPDVKREIFNLFFTKQTLDGGKLILEPTPIMQHVSVISNLSHGRDDRT